MAMSARWWVKTLYRDKFVQGAPECDSRGLLPSREWNDSRDGADVVAVGRWFHADMVRGKKESARAGC